MQHINGTPDLAACPRPTGRSSAAALSKKPDDRWPSCAEMVRGLGMRVHRRRSPAARRFAPGPAPDAATRRAAGPTPGSARLESAESESVQPTRMAPGGRAASARSGECAQSRLRPRHRSALPPLVNAGRKPARRQHAGAAGARPSDSSRRPPPAPGTQPITLRAAECLPDRADGQPRHRSAGEDRRRVLFPALVVAVGQTGRRAVEHLKLVIRDRYGTPTRCRTSASCTSTPIRPRPPRRARRPGGARPARGRDRPAEPPRPLPPARLAAAGRSVDAAGEPVQAGPHPGAADGVRAFGRLALFDNYRLVAQRVRQEIETFLTDEPLAKADKATGLGLRTNRPRAYVVAGPGGGTGGGMFLDLAYLDPPRTAAGRIPASRKWSGCSSSRRRTRRRPATPRSGIPTPRSPSCTTSRRSAAATRPRSTSPRRRSSIPSRRSPGSPILPLPKTINPKEQAAMRRRARRGHCSTRS